MSARSLPGVSAPPTITTVGGSGRLRARLKTVDVQCTRAGYVTVTMQHDGVPVGGTSRTSNARRRGAKHVFVLEASVKSIMRHTEAPRYPNARCQAVLPISTPRASAGVTTTYGDTPVSKWSNDLSAV